MALPDDTAHSDETPFVFTYSMEALIPVEVAETSLRVHFYRPESNLDRLGVDKDLLEERREVAAIRNTHYKRVMVQYHNLRVKERVFQVRD